MPKPRDGLTNIFFHIRENLEQKFAQYGKLETVTLINPLVATGKTDVVPEEPVQEKPDPKAEATDESPIQPATEESNEGADKTTAENSIKAKKTICTYIRCS
jgi:hypothetical protein